MPFICRLKRRSPKSNIEKERKVRTELVTALRQTLSEWDIPAFVTDIDSEEQAKRMRCELEYCADLLERMFFRPSQKVFEYAENIKTAIETVRIWKNDLGGQSVVEKNVKAVRDYIDKWLEL